MTACLVDNEGAIGYIDSAHGHEEGLNEIALSNGDGVFLTTKDAGVEGIQAAATDLSDAPDSADGDFSSVAFYNKVCYDATLACIQFLTASIHNFTTRL